MLKRLGLILTLLLVAACSSDSSLADELALDSKRPTFVMFYTQP
jgi:hypothetical protein